MRKDGQFFSSPPIRTFEVRCAIRQAIYYSFAICPVQMPLHSDSLPA